MLSILGLYNWDASVFEGFRTPENVDRQTAIDNILMECAELEIIYPSFEMMKFAIKNWTDKEYTVWEELQKTKEYVYNPIWNKDGNVTETETRNLTKRDAGSGSKTTTEDLLTTIDTTGENSGEGDSENSIMGYNSTNYEKKDKNESSSSAEYEDHVTNTGDNTITHADSHDYTETDTGTITHTRTETGNIGVTTTQQMIKEQREVVQFNIYDFILESFKKRFCLMVY